jgi:hypothetical protein
MRVREERMRLLRVRMRLLELTAVRVGEKAPRQTSFRYFTMFSTRVVAKVDFLYFATYEISEISDISSKFCKIHQNFVKILFIHFCKFHGAIFVQSFYQLDQNLSFQSLFKTLILTFPELKSVKILLVKYIV